MIEHPQQFSLIGVQPLEQTIQRGEAGRALKDAIKACPQFAAVARHWVEAISLKVGTEPPHQAMAAGMTFVIMLGGIDLSVQSVASFASVLVAEALPTLGYAAFPAAVLVGLVAGLMSGFVHVRRCCMDRAGGAAGEADVGGLLVTDLWMPTLPFKLNAGRRHHIPKQKRKVMNSAAYDTALRQRGSLTVWFTEGAVASWRAEPRTTAGGQSWYSPLAILTALTLRAVFRLALRQTEGLIGSIIHLLGLTLAVPDHTTLSRRAGTLQVPRPRRDGAPMHLLVDSTGLKPCGAGEWLIEKHGTKTRRSWRTLRIGMDTDTGQIVAAALTRKEVDDGSQVGPLLDQVAASVASFTADGAYDQDSVSAAVAERYPAAAIIVPPRSTAVPSEAAETAPTQRDRHLQFIAEHGRAAWQKASGYTKRARVEATIGRFKQVIGDGLRSRTDPRRATEVDVAVHVLNRILDIGRPISVRIA